MFFFKNLFNKQPQKTEEELLSNDIRLLKTFDEKNIICNGSLKLIFNNSIVYYSKKEIQSSVLSVRPLTKWYILQSGLIYDNRKWFNSGYKWVVNLTGVFDCPFYLRENSEKYADKMAQLLQTLKNQNN